MATPFLAEIKMFGGNFAIRNYAFCNGQLLSIAQNTAVFALLGTTYGGNGQTTFGLPNMQGRSPVHWGTGSGGLTSIQLGQTGGTETATLTTSNLPVHTHAVSPLASTATGTASSPAGAVPAVSSTRGEAAYAPSPGNTTLAGTTSSATGSGQAFAIRSPYLGVSFIIALSGIFPSRS